MMRSSIVAFCLIAAASGRAQPQSAPAPGIDLSGAHQQTRCKSATPGELVVCGERGPSPYRLDPTVLDAERSKEAASNPPRVQDRSGAPQACGTVRIECGGDAIPLLEPALRVATAVVKAVQGDDWREPFRNGPTDYERYQDAREKRPRSSISVGVSVSSGNER
jgi:hypothetical protein